MIPQTISEMLEWAEKSGISLRELLRELNARFDTFDPKKYKTIKLEAGMYQDAQAKKMSFTDLLESMDPSEEYRGSRLNAFERQLAVRNLNVFGKRSITLEEWYNTPDSRVLFPEFVNQNIQIGLLSGVNQLKAADVVAITTMIDSGTYEASIISLASDVSMGAVPQGTEMPTITVSISDKPFKLRKRGGVIKQTYESLRRIRANKMAVIFQLFGMRMSRDIAEDAVDVLINGNTGNNNSAFGFAASGLDYPNFVGFWAEFDPYDSNVLIMDKTSITNTLLLAEFKHPDIGGNFQRAGQLVTPFGNTIKRHDNADSTVLADKVLGVDNRYSLEEVVESGSMIQETDRLMTSQWERIAVSRVQGYFKMFAEAAGVWNYA